MTAPRRTLPVEARSVVVLLVLLALVPVVSALLGETFTTTLFSRVLVLAIAASGLNLALGHGGMVSFGHALFLAVGAYAVGILSHYGVTSGWLHVMVAVAVTIVLAGAIGVVCLRTAGMAFIMITLAFAQMFYFLAVSVKLYGGDEGMSIEARSRFWPFAAEGAIGFYYLCLAVLAVVLLFAYRMPRSHFGMVLKGSRLNAARMGSLGVPTLRYRLTAYVLSAVVCAIAGVLLANLTRFVSPSYMNWSMSGELIVMVVLGGAATVTGPVLGAAAIVLLEEALISVPIPGVPALEAFTHTHWKIALGVFIIGVLRWRVWRSRAATATPGAHG